MKKGRYFIVCFHGGGFSLVNIYADNERTPLKFSTGGEKPGKNKYEV
jgi:hypothetical protein